MFLITYRQLAGLEPMTRHDTTVQTPTDFGGAENSDVPESGINAIREAFDSSMDDETIVHMFGEALDFVIHVKPIKSGFCIQTRTTYSARPVIRKAVLPQPVATSTSRLARFAFLSWPAIRQPCPARPRQPVRTREPRFVPPQRAHRSCYPPFIFRRGNSMFRHETPRGSAPPFRRLNPLAIPKVSIPCGEAPTLFSKLLLIKRCQVAVYSTGTTSRTISQPSLVPSPR